MGLVLLFYSLTTRLSKLILPHKSTYSNFELLLSILFIPNAQPQLPNQKIAKLAPYDKID